MSEPKQKPSYAILISSCDETCDLWPIFFHFFFKHWPDVPAPVYLTSNFHRYDDPRVTSLQVGPDDSWGHTITRSLDRINVPFIYMILDDMFFDRDVDSIRVERSVNHLREVSGIYLETGRVSRSASIADTEIVPITPDVVEAGVNSAIYSRELLLHLAKPGRNVWQGNSILSQMNRDAAPGLYIMNPKHGPLISYVESVKAGFWREQGAAYLDAEGIPRDNAIRRLPVYGNRFFPKLLRSIYKRQRRFGRWKKRLLGNSRPNVVRPLPLLTNRPSL